MLNMGGLWIYKLVKVLLLLDISVYCGGNHVIDKCQEQCDTSEDSNDSSWACDSSCRVQQCDNGCLLWQRGVVSTCQDICDDSQISSKEVQHCIAGCNLAVDIYAQEVKDALSPMPRPALVFESETNTSVTLDWQHTTHGQYNVSLRLQITIPDLTTDWQDHDNIEWLANSRRVKVKGLRPYTLYKFRIVAEIVNGRHFKTSNSSANIRTKPYGVPVEPPTIVNIAAGSTYIHIKLTPPFYTNDRPAAYEVKVTAYYPTTAELPSAIGTLHAGIFTHSVVITGSYDTAVVTRLTPDTEYRVDVKFKNVNGVGPRVTTYIHTLAEKKVNTTKFLLYGADNTVLKQPTSDINSRTETLFQARQPENYVTGVAFHFKDRLVFVSVASGAIYSVSEGEGGEWVEREIYFSNNQPTGLDVDWLNDRLYVAEKDMILTCSLDGDCQIAVDNLDSKPEEVKVDPGSGYLFWIQKKPHGGIYRRDLTNLGESQGTSLHDDRIIEASLLLSFAIDHANYRLFYANSTTNTMMSAQLDGTDIRDIRQNVQAPSFHLVSSMAFYDDLFIFTDGEDVISETKDGSGRYYHNSIYTEENRFTGLNIWHANSQPFPVPYLPPMKLQALFSDKVAQLTWEPPTTGQGQGAWNTWFYEVEVITLSTGHNHTFGKLRQLNLSVQSVLPDTTYSFRVRAFSTAGKGPWSEAFVGSTLQEESAEGEVIVVDSENAVFSMSLSGDNQRLTDLYLGFEALKKFEMQGGQMLWSSEDGHLFHSKGVSPIPDLTNIHTFAYDWIGNTLYWAPTKPPKNMIKRLSLEPVADNYPETIVQDAMGFSVEDIVIDAVEGYVYFTTHISVEAARLDGRDYVTIHREDDYYSGKYVLGLALDYTTDSLYWLLKTTESIVLYRAPLFTLWEPQTEASGLDTLEPEPLFSFHTPNMPRKVEFHSNKLFWKSEEKPELQILDIGSQSLSYMPVSVAGESIRAFVVNYPSKYKLPESEDPNNIDVLPDEVYAPSIKSQGRWDRFDITWSPSKVGYGQVYYDVVLQDKHPIEKRAEEPHLSYIKEFKPYTLLTVVIKACTSWRCSKATGTKFYTPMAVPSKPDKPRAYVTHQESLNSSPKKIAMEFHWNEPDPPNGIIKQYNVKISPVSPNGPYLDTKVDGQQNYYEVRNTKNNTVYYFMVQACTEAGCSSYTDTISANTTEPRPVPKLLTTSETSANLFLPNEKRSQTVVNDDICSLTYIAREDTYFWINNKGTIVKQDSEGEQELVSTNNTTGKSLTVDWVGRDLYWSAQTNRRAEILKYDLNKQQGSKPVIVVSRSKVVWRLDISPYKSSLYWTETTTTHGYANLYTSDLKGTNPRSFFLDKRDRLDPTENRIRRQDCSCSGIQISPVFIIDHSEGTDAELYFAEAGTKNIWAAQLDGCQCRLVLNGTTVANNQSLDLPPDTMTIDQERLYWSQSGSARLHSISKWTGDALDSVLQDTGSLKDIKAVGNHLQPMPDTKCLLIESYSKKPRLVHSTNTTIGLNLKAWNPSNECATISAPTVKYLVHYKEVTDGQAPMPCDGVGMDCDAKESFELSTELTGLKPHTSYLVQVAATNYYMESRQRRAVYAAHDIYTTSNGVPSAPRKFSAIAATPTQVNITWKSPISPNAPFDQLEYELEYHYMLVTASQQSKLTIQGTPTEGQGEGMTYSHTVNHLLPATKYFFKILVRSDSQTASTPSPEVEVVTFQTPSYVQFLNKTESSLGVSWQSPNDTSVVTHRIEYAYKDSSGYWVWNTNASEVRQTLPNTLYIQEFTSLQPFTHYTFRVHVVYESGEPYTWPQKVTKTFRTKATIPSIPSEPQISTQGRLTVLQWEQPEDGGVPILYYTIYATSENDPDVVRVHNSTENRWIIQGLTEGEKYTFSVAATNSQGSSETSINSTLYSYVTLPEAWKSNDSEKLTVILSTCFGVIFLLVVMAMLLLLWRRYKDPKAKQFGLVSGFRRPDMELATLREMPRVAMTSNALYAINIIPTDEGIAALPHYHREELCLTKFLGSGAFGEVYEGIAQNILSSDSGETKVAVKALKKGATDNEKEEFLKEALLMSNFKHMHILSLLGVCLHNDPQFIILELMEGGDLLTYLRSSRPSRIRHGYLQLSDMVCMTVDIAKGCKYLEELHFVHRDLAARNCLVSCCEDPCQRVVKIGDFGLARDIYKSDYYRKEGEGLMPVRWMSPESLVDGVFTTNSDVWAFGVLMWEILTLGQQPYPARTNLDVLNFVRRGGRLDRPDNCPDDMYELMLTCWSYNPEMRPSFHTILENLEAFKEKSLDPGSDFYNKRPTSSSSLSVKIPSSEDNKQTDTHKSKQKNLKSNNVKRSFSFDVKGRFGIHPSGSKNSHNQLQQQQQHLPPSQEGSGYLEPLVPAVENKYLELLRDTDACAKCGRVGCDDRCHRGLLRHSSDCSQSLQRRQQQQEETGGNNTLTTANGGGKLCSSKKGGKGKGSKLMKCDNKNKTHRSDGEGLNTSELGGGAEGVKTRNVNGSRYHNISHQENLWKLGHEDDNHRNSHYGPGTGNHSSHGNNRNSSGSVPGFLIHPHNVKRCSVMSDDTTSLQSLSLPPDFDELAPNNRSSVDSNSPLLMWGSSSKDKGKSPSSSNRSSGLYQNGQTPGVKKYTLEDMDYLRRVASPMYNLENSEESLV